MTILTGSAVCGGIAIGKLRLLRRENAPISKQHVHDTEAEIGRIRLATETALSELQELEQKARQELGENEAAIFEIHGMMLKDEDYQRMIESTVRTEQVNGAYAVSLAAEHFASLFSAMDDAYMRARAADVRDVSARLCRLLSERKESPLTQENGDEPYILCADDLSPAETMSLDRSRILAIVTAEGSANSHTAILARTIEIPAVVGVGPSLRKLRDGDLLGVDGSAGRVYLAPEGETLAALKEKRQEHEQEQAMLQQYRGLGNVTRDGKRVAIYANVQSLDELDAALANDAGGIGLFRSEFLYLDRSDYPDEEEQFCVYRRVLQKMGERLVVIRTLDVGADKQAAYFGLAKEENPALGVRGIRVSLSRTDIFQTQLRALIRASVYGKLGIMFPMITSVTEVNEALTLFHRTKAEVKGEGSPLGEIQLGIMIETPAAAIVSDRLAPLVDFFSVGTNDLSQYTLAIDRQNPHAARFFQPHHEAILRLIEESANQAHRHGKWIGICGELGADLALTERFLRMGIDEFSVTPSRVLPLRKKIREIDLRQNGTP